MNRTLISAVCIAALSAMHTVSASTRLAPRRPSPAVEARTPTPTARTAELPLNFSQRDATSSFTAHTADGEVAISPTGAVFTSQEGEAIRFQLSGAARSATMRGGAKLPGVANYLIGSDRSKWRTRVPTFGEVTCDGVYPGIDAVCYGDDGRVVWDFVVASHADPSKIIVEVDGADGLAIDADGGLVLRTHAGELRQSAPVAYQETEGVRRSVEVRFALMDECRYGFAIGDYDRTHSLVIDPTISFNFPFGGNANTFAYGIAMDGQGNTYITGATSATNLPAMGAIDTTLGGTSDAFVAKLNAAGTALIYSTYLGGTRYDSGAGIAVDASGAAYVTGITGIDSTDDFPVTPGAAQTQFGGASDVFVAKLAPDGASLVYATYIGGPESYDSGNAIAVDAAGNAFVTGNAVQNFPTVNAFQPQRGGSGDGFIAKLNVSGSALLFSTYIGGNNTDGGLSIALSPSGHPVIAGFTGSTNLTTVNPCQGEPGGSIDMLVAMCDPDGKNLEFCTYYGGSKDEIAYGVACGPDEHVYCAGNTLSPDCPLVNPIQDVQCQDDGTSCTDGLVCGMNPVTGTVDYATCVAGDGFDYCSSIDVDQSGTAYVTGSTNSTNYPLVSPFSEAPGGNGDAFITTINPGGTGFGFSTLFGGTDGDGGYGIAVDDTGSAAAVAFTGGAKLEFSGVLGVEFGDRPVADLGVEPVLYISRHGDEYLGVLLVTFRNRGPDPAFNMVFAVDLPCIRVRDPIVQNPKLVLASTPQPGDEIVGLRGKHLGPMQKNESAVLAISVSLKLADVACLRGTEVRVTAAIASSSLDIDLSDNLKSKTVSIADKPTVSWEPPTTPSNPPGTRTLFTIGGSNRGDSSFGDGWSLAAQPTTPSVASCARRGGSEPAYKVYASQQPNVQPVPGNLFTTTPPGQTSADITEAPAGSFFVVTASYEDGSESLPSNEVGGVLPTISSVSVTAKKITAVSSGFPAGEVVLFGGVPFTAVAKLKKNNTKLVQKGATVIGKTPAQLIQELVSGSTVVILLYDTKGNGVGYVYTK